MMLGLALIVATITPLALSATAAEWRSRAIYQPLTDRFAHTKDSPVPCTNLKDYCGGTYQGLINHLDYIQDMGFDAIWISPTVQNFPGAYHGYAASDIYKVNTNFGSDQDLHNFIAECHKRGIWVMADIVANHMGVAPNMDYKNYTGFSPFNDVSHYHDCSLCPQSCNIENFGNDSQRENCRLLGLPDLNQTVPFVHDELLKWIQWMVKTYKFDGLRLDTAVEVPISFWAEFSKAAGVYTVGEACNDDDLTCKFTAMYQGPLDAVLSYPLWTVMREVFAKKASMIKLHQIILSGDDYYKDPSVLGVFLDNHDRVRFLFQNPDTVLYQAGLVVTVMTQGIPIIYYGSEQGYSGGSDPLNREDLWRSRYNQQHPLYLFIQKLIGWRKQYQLWTRTQRTALYDDQFFSFTRGDMFVATTNVGARGDTIVRIIPQDLHIYQDGQKLCNLFYFNSDCIYVQNGTFNVYLLRGEAKIFVPVQ